MHFPEGLEDTPFTLIALKIVLVEFVLVETVQVAVGDSLYNEHSKMKRDAPLKAVFFPFRVFVGHSLGVRRAFVGHSLDVRWVFVGCLSNITVLYVAKICRKMYDKLRFYCKDNVS